MNNFILFGNPIEHSKSPLIHKLFSMQTGITHHYGSQLVEQNDFKKKLYFFFKKKNNLGANITLPFKEQAFSLCNQLTKRCSLIGAVNTIKKQKNGLLLGDNTDGIGLIDDLIRLNLLHHKNSRILLIGAGGAARGVIFPLLNYGCKIILVNRTFQRAKKLIKIYQHFGKIDILELEKLKLPEYDLIINATSASLQNNIPILPETIINSNVCCYDMFYKLDNDTSFITWCRQHGTKQYADGLGMLVGQAAHSFLLWHEILPDILPILKILRS